MSRGLLPELNDDLEDRAFLYGLGAIMDQADMCQYRDVVDHSRAYTTVTSVA